MNDTGSRRAIAVAVLALLALIAGVISYEHGLVVARATRQPELVVWLLPLVPDLMIVGGSITLIEAASLALPRPLISLLAVLVGIGWTVAQNVAGGWDGGPGGRLVSGGVPVAFFLTFETLVWLLRQRRTRPDTTTQQPPATATAETQPAAPKTVEGVMQDFFALTSEREAAAVLGVTRDKIRTLKTRFTTTGNQEAA